MQTINELTALIIGLAIEVHRVLGPGLSEAGYEEALCIELRELKVTGRELGLILNFNEATLTSGIKRVVLQRGARTL